jgi:phosphoribosyl 1,2-cyclic phosphate phosphodiesterase
MQVTFLGTGAAEGYPAIWCRCERCAIARSRGGPNLRFRSSILVNDDLLIDPGPDLVASSIRHGLDLADVQAILITHLHEDHVDPTSIYWRAPGFAVPPLPEAVVVGTAPTLRRLHGRDDVPLGTEATRIRLHVATQGERLEIVTGGRHPVDPRARPERTLVPGGVPTTGPARRYEVVVVPASHAGPTEEASFFAIRQVLGPEADGRHDSDAPAILYATDTGPFSDAAWGVLDELGAAGWRYDTAILDATHGTGRPGTSHMNLDQVAWHHDELARRDLLRHGGRRMAHHFSHNGTPPHEELEALLTPPRIVPTYDGLQLDA